MATHSDVMTLCPSKLIAGGAALARAPDGRIVLLAGALPGERVSARVVDAKRDYLRAVTLTVLTAAPARRNPPCPAVARGCGGCDWQHVSPAAQLPFKAAILADALQRTARLPEVPIYAGVRIPDVGYRTTLRVGFDRAGRPGFRIAGSQASVSVDTCLVAHPALNALLSELRLPGAREALLRVGARTGDRLLRWWPDTLPVPSGLPGGIRTGPDAFVTEVINRIPLQVSAAAFFQSSPEAAEALIETVQRAAGDPARWGDGPVLDAYGGVGLFSATLVPADRERLVIESNPSACADARRNLAGLPARVLEQSLEQWQPRPMGLVIANPARAGLGKPAAAVLTATGAPVLVLVSCDPVACARDARLLVDHGYRLDYCEVLDLFPQTHHLEVVSRFVKTTD